jgi:hypothetical protein
MYLNAHLSSFVHTPFLLFFHGQNFKSCFVGLQLASGHVCLVCGYVAAISEKIIKKIITFRERRGS